MRRCPCDAWHHRSAERPTLRVPTRHPPSAPQGFKGWPLLVDACLVRRCPRGARQCPLTLPVPPPHPPSAPTAGLQGVAAAGGRGPVSAPLSRRGPARRPAGARRDERPPLGQAGLLADVGGQPGGARRLGRGRRRGVARGVLLCGRPRRRGRWRRRAARRSRELMSQPRSCHGSGVQVGRSCCG